MALFGLLSLAQIWFLPGYLLLSQTRGLLPADKWLLAVPLSATFNFFLVYALTLCGCYSQLALLVLLVVETAALLFIAWKKSAATDSLPKQTPRLIFEADFSGIIFALMSLAVVAQVFSQIGTVFTQGDAVSSWNPWAVAWFKGVIPTGIAWYPQMLPTLYSLTYQLMGDSRIELFAKIAESFYPLVVLGMFARMAVLLSSERKKLLWSAVILFLLVRRLWGGESAVNGYADFPLAFFCVSILYVFVLKMMHAREPSADHALILPIILVIITIGAGLMKQSGVFLGMMVPFAWLLFFRDHVETKIHFKQSMVIGLAIAAGGTTWYVYQYWRIHTGIDASNLKLLSGIIPMTWYESIAFGFKGITYKLSWLWVILFLASLAHRQLRWLSLCVVLPFFLLWAAFVPYDYRNLAPVFPLLALSLAYGGAEIAQLFSGKLITHLPLKWVVRGSTLAILVLFTIALANPKLNTDLLKLSNEAKKQIGDPELNSRLLAYFEFHPEPSRVATAYVEMAHLPEIGGRLASFSCGYDYGKQLSKLETVLAELDDPAIHHVLLLPWCDARVLNHFDQHPELYGVIFRHSGAIFYSIRSRSTQ